MNKVLIITYYWPPSGGSGVQRWLKFVKYLPSYQWEPHVFTPENPAFGIKDPSLMKDVPAEAEVIHFPIWEPYDIFFRMSRLFGSKKQPTSAALLPAGKKSFFQKVSTWIRGNFFVPDPRIFWVKPSVSYLGKYLAANGISVVVTTGPPHSMHLIGLKLKKKYPHIRWLADFRDPWTEWGMWDSLGVCKAVRRVHRRLEKQVLAFADEIITITPFYARQFEKLAGRSVTLLQNGFDDADFRDFAYDKPDRFVVRHVGVVNEKCDPRPFMRAMKEELLSDPDFARELRLEFIGDVHPDFRAYVAADSELAKVTFFTGNVPHDALIPLYGSSSLFLLILTGYKDAEGFLPGKLFEYLATGLPVLGVGPLDGDAASLLNETGAGVMVANDDFEGIRQVLRASWLHWRGDTAPWRDPSLSGRFSRRQITERLAGILKDQLTRSNTRRA